MKGRDQSFPRGRRWGTSWAETDASGRFELVGAVPADAEGAAEVYLGSLADDRWTYRPAGLMLRPGGVVEGVEIELVEGVEVTGHFVDADSGDPVAPVGLVVIAPGRITTLGSIVPRRTTDERGTFRLRLIPGEAELLAPELPSAYARSYPGGFARPSRSPTASVRSPCRRCGSDHRGRRPAAARATP